MLREKLADEHTPTGSGVHGLKRMIDIRIRQPAFHPNATQFTLQLGDALFGFWRQSMDRAQSIFAIHNVTDQEILIPVMSLNLIGGDHWADLLSRRYG